VPRRSNERLTAAQEILLGAGDLDEAGIQDFTEWDLTVATWKRNPNRFGCRGYEEKYPHHKRVMMEIMGNKKDNPVRLGRIIKTHPHHYRLTHLGRSEIHRLSYTKDTSLKSNRSPQPVYNAVAPFYRSPVFRKFCKDPEEPRMWLGAASFLGIKRNDAQHLDDQLKTARSSIENALEWLDEAGIEAFRSGTSGGEEAISKESLFRLEEFIGVLEKRFAKQIEAIRRTKR
jgi:hypothetical protein